MVDFCVEDFMEMRYHKLEIILKDRKIGKSDRKIGSDFEKKKIGSENRIGHYFKIVPSLFMTKFNFSHQVYTPADVI